MPTDIRYLFVYGTLMSGAATDFGAEQRVRLASESDSLGPASLPHALLYDLGRYPGAMSGGGIYDIVHGEVVLLADAVASLGWLDDYEGYAPNGDNNEADSNEYERAVRQVRLAGGETFDAWVYLLREAPADADACRIASGRWESRR